jgi:hypothetical protein
VDSYLDVGLARLSNAATCAMNERGRKRRIRVPPSKSNNAAKRDDTQDHVVPSKTGMAQRNPWWTKRKTSVPMICEVCLRYKLMDNFMETPETKSQAESLYNADQLHMWSLQCFYTRLANANMAHACCL